MSKLDQFHDDNMKMFEKEFFFLPMDVKVVMLNLLSSIVWGTPRTCVKIARSQWQGTRIQMDTALPVLRILSPSIKVEEKLGISTVYADDTFYLVWDTDEFVVQPDLKKLNEIISIRKDCNSSISKLLELL